MKWKRILFKTLKISGVATGAVLALLFILPFLFPQTISNTVKGWINQSIVSKVDFTNTRFTFFKHFPSLTFTLEDVSITGAVPFQNDTLISAKELSLGVNLLSVFSNSIKINQVFLSDAHINIRVDAGGNPNYDIYRSSGEKADTSGSQTGLQLENIVIKNTNLVYHDLSVPILISARNLSYKGTGDLSKEVFDLTTRLSADSFSLNYDGEQYVNNKKLRAKLLTAINTNSLSLVFGDNWLRVNTLPVKFSGSLDFLQHGYKMDLKAESRKARLENIVAAIPPDMTEWIEDTKLKGPAVFKIELKGIYDKLTNQMPDLLLNLNIHDGYIAYKGSPQPIQNLALNLESRLPSLNPDSLLVKLDTLDFSLGKGYFRARSRSVGVEYPYIEATAKADLDLSELNQAIGLRSVEMKGQYKLDFKAKGKYQKEQNPKRIRRTMVLTSIPAFSLTSSVQNGYLKFAGLPEAIQNIRFNINGSNTDHNYRHTILSVDSLHLSALKNVFEGHFRLTNPDVPHVDASLRGDIHLSEIARFVPLENMKVEGNMAVDIKMAGTYDVANKMFPVTNANLSMSNGKILTEYYPDPIEQIKVEADIKNSNGKWSGTTMEIQPVSFEFAGQPFTLKANLDDPENISYDIVSKGTLDIGKLYKVFGISGFNASGFIKTDLALKGKQSDAMAGRYHLLNNSGTLQLKDINLSSDLFPKPLAIHTGNFRFAREKMIFDRFESSYGDMKFVVNGYLVNVIGYALQKNGILKGRLSLAADKINLDEFTAFESPEDDFSRAGTDSSGTGVILVPRDISLLFTAKVKEADYNSVRINNFNGQLLVDSSKVKLQNTNFRLAGAPFNMDATYEGVTPHKGWFDFKVKADSFSIEKAYREIPLLREMVSSASGVQGMVGLNYSLNGRLDQNMMPVYPSLKGGGVINLKKVKLKGFKLMNAVSRSSERDELKDPELSGIHLKTTVNNNIITLERTKLRIMGFRPRFEGQVSLDGELNIKGRLGLPPLGIFGIPFTVRGTSEDPVVKLQRDKDGKVLQEKEDVEEDEGELEEQHSKGDEFNGRRE
ncbi:MAG: AsmA family protein [Chitinophagaceae bacterium]|nr:AsmA family protein [Chitinophagaceae bacterium]